MYSKKKNLDKFYTKESVAIECIKHLNLTEYDTVVEPSAGSGAFSKNIKHHNLKAFDIEPEYEGIVKQDWFEYSPDKDTGRTLVIGNPPFGLRNKLSKAFIEKSISFSSVSTVAFVPPDVYRKHTLQKIFTKGRRLKEIVNIQEDAFTIDGESYHVPCSFFIFDKSEGENLMFNVEDNKECKDFEYSTKENADLYIMGAGCKLKDPKDVEETNRGYYIKSKIPVNELKSKLNEIKWYGNSSANGGVWWLTKPELIKIYKDKYERVN